MSGGTRRARGKTGKEDGSGVWMRLIVEVTRLVGDGDRNFWEGLVEPISQLDRTIDPAENNTRAAQKNR